MAKRLNSAEPAGGSGAAYVPDFASKDNGNAYPHIPVTPAFLLVYSPKRWMIMDGRLVPSLSKLPLEPGVNRVDKTKDGRIRIANLRARLEEEDRKPIPYEWAPDGETYIRAVQTRAGSELATAYVSCFESVHAGDAATYPDETAYADWLERLVKDGKLPACPPHRAQKLLEQARGELRAAEADHAKAPSGTRALRVEDLTAKVAALEKAVGGGPKTRRVATKAAKPVLED